MHGLREESDARNDPSHIDRLFQRVTLSSWKNGNAQMLRLPNRIDDAGFSRVDQSEARDGRKAEAVKPTKAIEEKQMHQESILCTATAAATTGTAATAVAGDSLTTRNAANGTGIRALAIWGHLQTGGWIQYTTPSGHDQTRGPRMIQPTGVMLSSPLNQVHAFQPQELISPTIAGTAVAGDVDQMVFQMFYENLPGIDAGRRMKRWEEIEKRIMRPLTIEATLTGAAGPGYSGAELITAESNLLRAMTNYAVLGITTNLDCALVGILGPDTANQRAIVPGIASKPEITSQWFKLLSAAHDLPCIPIIHSGNKDSTSIFCAINENVINPRVSVHLALLDGEI